MQDNVKIQKILSLFRTENRRLSSFVRSLTSLLLFIQVANFLMTICDQDS